MSVSMCDNLAEERSGSNSGEIYHCKSLSDDIGVLALSEDYSDVRFVVAGQNFPAHKVILAARCHYFRALLFGGMREAQSQDEITIEDATAEAFGLLLKYIYTGKLKLGELSEDLMLEVLALSNKYCFTLLEKSISDYLLQSIDITNACEIFEVATLYMLNNLKEAAAEFIDRHALDIINGECFQSLSLEAITTLIRRDSFCASEKSIFKAVESWWDNNKYEVTTAEEKQKLEYSRQQLLAGVRLPLMSLQDLLHTVRPSGLIHADALLDAIQRQSEQSNMELNYRGVLCPEENVATLQHSAQVIKGDMCTALLDGDSTDYDMERGFTRHSIEDAAASSKREAGIVIKLGRPTIINHIRMLLWDKDPRAYSYYIEISMNDEDWVRVIDYSNMHCRSWQMLYFDRKVVRYIRVVGTNNTANKVFHLVSLEAMFTRKEEVTKDGVIVPQVNVATTERYAIVIEGVSRNRNALLNGEVSNYDWDSGYTCHQLGNGGITVQLNQPYMISSIRLLLWDIDERSYGYYIEVSVNHKEWTKVIDNSKKDCQSWQNLMFPPIPVIYIRIIGTNNTANEVFHCVHLECPSNVTTAQSGVADDTPSSGNAYGEETTSHSSVRMELLDAGDSDRDMADSEDPLYVSSSPPVMHDDARSRHSQDDRGSGDGGRSIRHRGGQLPSAK